MRTILTLLVLAVLAPPALAAEPASEKGTFKKLFDGKTFNGWEGDQKVFRIEDGAFVGGSLQHGLKQNEFLASEKEYGDFELRLKFKLVGKGVNGGVQLRSQRVPNSREMSGYQADMADGYWGCLYDESRRNKILAGPAAAERGKGIHREDWNDYRMLCQGGHIQLWVNGQQTVDYTEPDASLVQRGHIGLQIHGGGPSEAWYKDVEIREIQP